MMFNSVKHVSKIFTSMLTGIIVITGSVLLAGSAHAQLELGVSPAPLQALPSQPSTERPQAQGRTGGASSYQPGADYQTPAPNTQKAAFDKIERARQMEQNLRRMMASFGVTEPDTQNAIIVYVQEEVQHRQPLRDQGRRLMRALRDETISNTELAGLLIDFRAIVEADKARRTAAEAVLNERTKYATNPRLEAMLWLFGVIGDGPTIMTMPAPSPAPNSSARQPPKPSRPVTARQRL